MPQLFDNDPDEIARERAAWAAATQEYMGTIQALTAEVVPLRRVYCAVLDLLCQVGLEGEITINTRSGLVEVLNEQVRAYDGGDNKPFYKEWKR